MQNQVTEIFEHLFSNKCFKQNDINDYINFRIEKAFNRKTTIQDCIHQIDKLRFIFDEAKLLLRLYDFRPEAFEEDSEAYYTMDETCKILNISRSKLRDMIQKGVIDAYKENQRVFKPYKWSVNTYNYKRRGPSGNQGNAVHSFVNKEVARSIKPDYSLLEIDQNPELYFKVDELLKAHEWLNRRQRRINSMLRCND